MGQTGAAGVAAVACSEGVFGTVKEIDILRAEYVCMYVMKGGEFQNCLSVWESDAASSKML